MALAMRVRSQADSSSETITTRMMESRIAATSFDSTRCTLSRKYQPMPPAPKKPTTVAARNATSQV
jgi:hypothetical protein